jgi:hypothetical protein
VTDDSMRMVFLRFASESGRSGTNHAMGEESKDERINRELIELLNELRVALPGVQVLFAFLLIVPFSNGWKDVSDLQKDVYFATFLCTAIATALLIAPSAHHRLEFRRGDKEHLLIVSNRLAIAGTVFLALAIAGSVFVVTDVLFEKWSAALVAALSAALFGWFWYAMPLLRRATSRR